MHKVGTLRHKTTLVSIIITVATITELFVGQSEVSALPEGCSTAVADPAGEGEMGGGERVILRVKCLRRKVMSHEQSECLGPAQGS